MKLEEPLIMIIDTEFECVYFKKYNNLYLMYCSDITCQINDNFITEDKYIIVKGEDVIPFIIAHNARIDHLIYCSKAYNENHESFIKAYIENKLDTNITINDIRANAVHNIGYLSDYNLPLWVYYNYLKKNKHA